MSPCTRLAAVLLALSVVPASAAGAVLVPHRAVYDLSLADDRNQLNDSGSAVAGRMVFEFTGAECEGYTVNFRFVVETADGEGRTTVTDLRTSSFEEGGGASFQFLSQTYTNEVLTEEVKGTAKRGNDGTKVRLVAPATADVAFKPAPIFPTYHLKKILEAARAGDTVLEEPVFDGSESGDKMYRATAIIGAPRTGALDAEEQEIGTLRRWPVSVAYFDTAATGDHTPEYTISFDLWDNGVSTDLTMDYGDFALSGRLAGFEPLPLTPCPTAAD